MAYCGPRGIPLSTFLGWEQADQDAALSWAGYESRRCSSCGTHPDEPARHPHVDTCTSCVARDQAIADAKDLPGAHVHLVTGTPATCPRCQLEIEANAAGGGRGRPPAERPRPPHQ